MSVIPMLGGDELRMYDGSLIADLQLDKLLSNRALRILRMPCQKPCAQTIADRQAFFACMDDPAFAERLEAFQSALFRLSVQLEQCKEPRVELEGLCLRIRALSAYLVVCQTLEALGGSNRILAKAYEELNDTEHRALLTVLEADLSEAELLIKRMESSVFLLNDSISFADSAWLLKDNGEMSFGEQFVALARKMGVEIALSDSRSMKLDAMIDAAYIQLYHEEVDGLRSIVERYTSLDLSAPLIWMDELAFFREIYELVQKARAWGIPTCLPTVSSEKCYRAKDVYDITLTVKDHHTIVPNDIDFSVDASFCFLTGANGGGKTTYLRAVGVNLLFFLAGCPIFAQSGAIYPFSGVFSHFPEDEVFSGMGRLDSEKLRIDQMLERADEDSFVLLNETFSATDEEKGFHLALQTANTMKNLGIYGLYVTHFLEVKTKGFPILSAVVEEDDLHRRTFKIYRSSGAHSSYARDILRKYHLDEASLAKRRAGR